MTASPHFSKSADNNKDVILQQLRRHLVSGAEVLEIASGTGQHAVHFAGNMPEIFWQPSDRDIDEYELRDLLSGSLLKNLKTPIILDVSNWPETGQTYDAVYSANCIHIMPVANLDPYVVGAANALNHGGALILYGPFKYDGAFTTGSNEQFDAFLRANYSGGGIRDFEQVDRLATENGLSLLEDVDMPANNQLIIWQKAGQ